MLTTIFSNLEYHFRKDATRHDELDESFFMNFQDITIKELYDNMLKFTNNTVIICNIIYQMLKRDPSNIDVIWAAVGAIDYQNKKMRINKKLFSITEKCIEKNRDMIMEHLQTTREEMKTMRIQAYFGHMLTTTEHEPIYSFKMF